MSRKAKTLLCMITICYVIIMLNVNCNAYSICDIDTYLSDEAEQTIYYDVPISEELQDYIRETLDSFDVDIENGFEVILAMAHTESRFHLDSQSGRCKGIMQVSEIHRETLDELGIADLFDPYDCFKAGIYYFKCGLNRADAVWEELDECELDKSDFVLNYALMSYNLGNRGADKKVKSGVYSTSYVEKVREAIASLEIKSE